MSGAKMPLRPLKGLATQAHHQQGLALPIGELSINKNRDGL